MSKKYNKNFFKELREKSSLYYSQAPALNWGRTVDGKYTIEDRYHFNWKIQNENGGMSSIEKDVKKHIEDFVVKNNRKVTAYIGVDSQNYLSFTRFVSVIVLYVEKNGAHVIMSRADLPKIYDFRYKLLKEVDMIGELARNYKDFFKSIDVDFELHADLNKSSNHKSNGVVEEATNYISHLGFKLKIKNEAFAATYAADSLCK